MNIDRLKVLSNEIRIINAIIFTNLIINIKYLESFYFLLAMTET